METDVSTIKETLNQYAVAINAGDLELWMSLWADGARRMAPNAPVQIGKEQIREAVTGGFGAMDMAMTVQLEEAEVYGDFGLTRCTYTLKMTPKAGGQEIIAEPDGKALTLYQRQSDGSWKIAFDCYNTSVAPAQP